ncbi:MAG: hypothetical protein HY290_06870 [Planctomycetia bacterium]|nr:hypothetical protein [Planctomycetia bacterium]
MLNRLGDNSYVGNSNGDPHYNDSARPYKGVPITLQVPSHLDVFIDETYYLQKSSATPAEDQKDITVLEEAAVPPLRSVRAETVKTKKVFFVDFKRPGSGSLDVSATFNDDQYFKNITSKLVDTTIKDTAALAGTIIKGAKGISTAGTLTKEMMKQTRVVAYRRFDINEPDFDMQVDEFVRVHLADCCPSH